MSAVWRAFVLYAAAMIAAGLAWGWRAPLGWDEQKYYLPAAEYFAERLPRVPLDYPMPMPPFALVVQGAAYRLSGSVALLRMLSTAAAIAAAAVFAGMLKGSRRDALLLLMFGTFPAALMNAFTLKHHAAVILCCIGALAAWQRKRVVLAALLLTIGALTHQLTVAMIGTLVVLSLFERRMRDAAILALSALPLAVLLLLWRGARPPMHEATFTGEPAMTGLQPAQILVLLFMAGAWIAPAVSVRWLAAAIALPFTAAWMYAAGLMRHASSVYERLAGPVSSAIAAATRQHDLLGAIAAGALAALGAALLTGRHRSLSVWAGIYALVMLAVPYFFESYYALFVTISWVLLRERISERPPWFPLAAIAAGIGYVIVKV